VCLPVGTSGILWFVHFGKPPSWARVPFMSPPFPAQTAVGDDFLNRSYLLTIPPGPVRSFLVYLLRIPGPSLPLRSRVFSLRRTPRGLFVTSQMSATAPRPARIGLLHTCQLPRPTTCLPHSIAPPLSCASGRSPRTRFLSHRFHRDTPGHPRMFSSLALWPAVLFRHADRVARWACLYTSY